MRNTCKVNIILVIVSIIAILITIFALSRSGSNDFIYSEEYEQNIKILSDTITELKKDIIRYEEEIKRIDLERETIQKELRKIVEDNGKIDSELATGDWDDNIRFLTEFLSEEDSFGE